MIVIYVISVKVIHMNSCLYKDCRDVYYTDFVKDENKNIFTIRPLGRKIFGLGMCCRLKRDQIRTRISIAMTDGTTYNSTNNRNAFSNWCGAQEAPQEF